MKKIITYNFSDNFIEELTLYLKADFKSGNDLSRTAIVFGGKRPALFLKRSIASELGTSFIPPAFFSINEFVHYIIAKNNKISNMTQLEACFAIYTLVKTKVPQVLKSRKSFAQFMPWASEIVSFIDHLDLEDISKQRLVNIEANAEIGYEVPESFNRLLENIVILRDLYHEKMKKEGKYSRGLSYLAAAGNCQNTNLEEFDRILFCNFFKLHQTQMRIIKNYYDKDKAVLFFQKDSRSWAQFDELSAYFNADIIPKSADKDKENLKLYAGFDTHSQVGIIREILNTLKAKKSNTVIVLPQPESLIPLLSEIASSCDEFNVSMGYPLRRSTVYNLFELISRAQKTKKDKQYYTRDYLALLMHPLVKNLIIHNEPAVTRVLVHKIEEMLLGINPSPLAGSLFIYLDSVVKLDNLLEVVQVQLKSMSIDVSRDEIKNTLRLLHEYAFSMWEKITTLGDFSTVLDKFLDILVEKSLLDTYPLNIKIIEKVFSLSDQLRNRALACEEFTQLEVFKVFDDFLKREKIAFTGTPLKGLQILGLFETRALTFENVIIMDVNESVLPRIRTNEPLVPRSLLVSLGFDRLEEEEAIQRYEFMRLIKSAKNVHLVYNDSPDKQKSRFIEEIIWEQEKKSKKINNLNVPRAVFNCDVMNKVQEVYKNEKIKEFLEGLTFSASSLNVYLKCPMQFYYKYVLGLSETEDMLDELESREVGTFIHELLEYTFLQFVNKTPKIDESFRTRFFAEFDKRFDQEFKHRMKSGAFMTRQIMRFRLEKFLDNEQQRQVLSIAGLEADITKEIKLGHKMRKIAFKCRIDRIDRIDEQRLQVLDYKTGSSDSVPAGLKTLQKALENPDRKKIKKAIKSFQLPLYLYCVEQEYNNPLITSALYNLRTLKIDEFPKPREFAQKDEIMKCALEMLGIIIDEIYDSDVPFVADDSDDACKYCPFISLCR